MSRILVIDDEPQLRSTIVTILNREGFAVEDAADGQTGMATFQKSPPDLVITDIFMPNKDGIEIIKELKRASPLTKIIAMTGGGQIHMMEMASAARILGADYVLQKPFERKTLVEAVNALLSLADPSTSSMTGDGSRTRN